MNSSTITAHRPWLEIAIRSLCVFLVYGGVIVGSSLFTFEPTSTPMFWPANAIVLGIMLYATTQRAMIYLGAAALSYFVYLYFFDAFGFGPSCLLTSANMIEIVAGYVLIYFLATWPLQFGRLKNTIEMIVYGVILNSIVGATAGTYLMSNVWEAPTLINWTIWFETAVIGYLMVLPLMISWMSPTSVTYSPRHNIEIALLFVFCIVASLIIFGADKDNPLVFPYFVFPVLLLSSIRFDLRITSIAFLLFLVISSIKSSQGLGPFAMGEFYREIVLVRFNLFCGITIITVLLVSALRNEREELINELRDAFSQIKTLSGFIPICANCKKIRDDSGYWNQLEGYIQEHSDAELSHGICPTCAKELYGEYYHAVERKKNSNDGQ